MPRNELTVELELESGGRSLVQTKREISKITATYIKSTNTRNMKSVMTSKQGSVNRASFATTFLDLGNTTLKLCLHSMYFSVIVCCLYAFSFLFVYKFHRY